MYVCVYVYAHEFPWTCVKAPEQLVGADYLFHITASKNEFHVGRIGGKWSPWASPCQPHLTDSMRFSFHAF